jgi:hypothetical protein
MLLVRDEDGEIYGPHKGHRLRLWSYGAVLAMAAAVFTAVVILFLVTVVAPSAGAAGGCGGG